MHCSLGCLLYYCWSGRAQVSCHIYKPQMDAWMLSCIFEQLQCLHFTNLPQPYILSKSLCWYFLRHWLQHLTIAVYCCLKCPLVSKLSLQKRSVRHRIYKRPKPFLDNSRWMPCKTLHTNYNDKMCLCVSNASYVWIFVLMLLMLSLTTVHYLIYMHQVSYKIRDQNWRGMKIMKSTYSFLIAASFTYTQISQRGFV